MKTKENIKKGVKNNSRNSTNNIFYKTNPSGISLIVLVITIIVIIILAAVAILTLNKNNPIEEANDARYESDVANMQAVFTNTVAKVMAQNQCTIGVNAGSLNSVQTVENGVNSAEGRVNYILNNPENSSNENGTIVFNTGTNNATIYYTGRKLPLYSAGKTVWYVDSEGVISLKIDDKEYGKGNKTDKPAGDIKEEIEITSSSNPMLQSWTYKSTTDFHNSVYKSKITKIKFARADKVPGNRIEEWDVSNAKDKSVMAWVEDDNAEGYILTIAGKDKIVANTDSSYLFYNFSKVKEIVNLNILDTKNVGNMHQMFRGCANLENLDLSSFDTNNVTNISTMFMDCSNLTSLNLSNFNTSNVTYINDMFRNCSNLISLDISSFNTSKVKSFITLFSNCNALKNLKLGSSFTFSNVDDIQRMFENCNNLTTTINMDRIKTGNILLGGAFLINAAIIPPAQITLNYTSSNENLVDSLINNKGNSNIVKGNLIE